ncbi:MAG: hypothetical protein KKB25_01860 [Nanoarchaeota archaeon]|nr:hypothetical protein [Nanoarchaeota archaeon]
MEDYYREVLDADKKNIWRGGSKFLYEYGKLNAWPNIKLNSVEREIFAGDIEKAGTLLNDVKTDLADFGKNWLLSAIYDSLETGGMLRLGPDPSYTFSFDDYMYRSFYNMNFMKMREKQLKGKKYEAKVIRKNLLDENFLDDFADSTNCYIQEKRNGKAAKNSLNLKDMIFRFVEVHKNTALIFSLAFPLSYMALTGGGGCPYQRSRFYSAMMEEKDGSRGFDSELLSSDFHKKLFLPNYGMDGCTQKELEVFNNVKGDEKEFRRATKKWNSQLVRI